jgi:hypothetical protein
LRVEPGAGDPAGIWLNTTSMNYLLLAYQDEQQWSALPADEQEALEAACLAHEQALWQSGRLLIVMKLPDSHNAMVLQLVNGRVNLTESFPAGTPGQLVQLFFISARDLNEALRLAAQMPQVRRGPVEVRPVALLDRP